MLDCDSFTSGTAMRTFVLLLITLICFCFAAFSVFGFLATFEPGPRSPTQFRVGYSVLGLSALAAGTYTVARVTRPNRPA